MTEPTRTRTDRLAYVLAQVAAVLAVGIGFAMQVLLVGPVRLSPDLGWAVGLTAVVVLSAGVALARVSPSRIALLHVVPALLLTRWWFSGASQAGWFAWSTGSAGDPSPTLALGAVRVAVPVLLGLLWTLTGIGIVTQVRRTPEPG